MIARAALALACLATACSDSNGTDGGTPACTTHTSPSFVLGTGNDRFLGELTTDQDLQMERGPQGGCHLPLAFQTDGFAQRRFTVNYRLSFADDPTDAEIIRSRETRNLIPRDDAPGKCELLAFRAFLLEPWEVEDQRVRVKIDVEDDLGATGSAEVIVRATWPDEVTGTLRENLCGMPPDRRD